VSIEALAVVPVNFALRSPWPRPIVTPRGRRAAASTLP